MSSTAVSSRQPAPPVRGPMSVLASARAARTRAEEAEVQVLVDAVDWAVANPPLFSRDAAVATVEDSPGRRPATEPLCADGVPEVSRAAVAELGLALGTSTQAAQGLIADALELAYRLPGMWTRTVAGEVKPWRARQAAQATRPLGRLAAAFVDRQLAPVAHRVGARTLQQLVATAIARFDPEVAERATAARSDGRFVQVSLEDTSLAGLTPVAGVIDAPDALDLNAALAHGAAQLAAWGSSDSLDARRARALGDLAREHLSWNATAIPGPDAGPSGSAGTVSSPTSGRHGEQPGRTVRPKRQVVLYVHLTEGALQRALRTGCGTGRSGPGGPGSGLVGRVENTGTPVTADTIRDWCSDAGARVSVRPVIDLAEHLQADAYEIPARLREQIRLRDGSCLFPGCHAKALSCQDDHEIPYRHEDPSSGGQTESSNLHLLCQRHHNLKTHHGFSYTTLPSGAVLWRTPHGARVRVDTDGTTSVEGLPPPPSGEPEAP